MQQYNSTIGGHCHNTAVLNKGFATVSD